MPKMYGIVGEYIKLYIMALKYLIHFLITEPHM